MAEAVKQFFVGFIHPRTWLAALIGIVAAFLVAIALGSGLGGVSGLVTTVANQLFAGDLSLAASYLQSLAGPIFLFMLQPYTGIILSIYGPAIVLAVGGVVAGLLFGLTAKKERVASKSIIGGLNIAVIYLVIVGVALLIWGGAWTGSLGAFGAAAWAFIQALGLDMLVSFLVVWWVAAIISILILSMKHD
nr:hypothetical protein [Candidatus Njordarchaeum guaymaensis]